MRRLQVAAVMRPRQLQQGFCMAHSSSRGAYVLWVGSESRHQASYPLQPAQTHPEPPNGCHNVDAASSSKQPPPAALRVARWPRSCNRWPASRLARPFAACVQRGGSMTRSHIREPTSKRCTAATSPGRGDGSMAGEEQRALHRWVNSLLAR